MGTPKPAKRQTEKETKETKKKNKEDNSGDKDDKDEDDEEEEEVDKDFIIKYEELTKHHYKGGTVPVPPKKSDSPNFQPYHIRTRLSFKKN